jgi:hypothetical protein
MSKLFNIKNITVLSQTFTRKLNTASFNSLGVSMFEMCPAPLRVTLLFIISYSSIVGFHPNAKMSDCEWWQDV